MREWKKYKLGEISNDVSYGYTESANENPVGPKFLRITDIREGSINWDKVPYCVINEKDYIKNKIEIGDIVVARTGATTGITETIKHKIDAVFASYLIRFRINKSLANPFYVGHVLKSHFWKDYVSSIVGGSAQPGANAKQFSDFLINLPDLPTQTAIAEILSSLDDKIELNNKINQELENLAQTLFKQWFIDFEFPNENGEPYKSSGGEMVESELGEIPRGWEILKVQDLEHKLQTGTRPKGGVGGITQGVPSIGAESIKKLGYYDFSKVKFVTEEFAAKMKRGKVEGYELLIYKDGGKPGTFIPHFSMFGEGFPFDSFFINEHVFLLDFFNKHFNSFCYFYFDSEYVRPVFENNGGKAAIPGINQEDVKNLWVFNPNLEVVKLFGEFAHSSVSTILKNCKENIQLTNLRDTLLPKLISGELEVSQTQTTA